MGFRVAYDTLGALRKIVQTSCGPLLPALGPSPWHLFISHEEKKSHTCSPFPLVAEEREKAFVMSHSPFCSDVPCYSPVLQMCGFLILAARVWRGRLMTPIMILANGSEG